MASILQIGNNIDAANNLLNVAVESLKDYSVKNYALVEKVKSVFLGLNIAATIWNAGVFLYRLDQCYDFTKYSELALRAMFWGGCGVVVAISYFGTTLLLKVVKKTPDFINDPEFINQPELNNIQIDYSVPNEERDKIYVYMGRLVLQAGIAFLKGQSTYLTLLNTASLGYSILKCATRKWLCMDTSRQFEGQHIDAINAKFHVPIIKKQHQDNCAICFDEKPTVPFCRNHFFHEKCLARIFFTKPEKLDPLFYHKNRSRISHLDRWGREESISYKIEMGKNQIKNCPLCRGNLDFYKLDMQIKDRAYKEPVEANVVFI